MSDPYALDLPEDEPPPALLDDQAGTPPITIRRSYTIDYRVVGASAMNVPSYEVSVQNRWGATMRHNSDTARNAIRQAAALVLAMRDA